jgi:hypothetical protein
METEFYIIFMCHEISFLWPFLPQPFKNVEEMGLVGEKEMEEEMEENRSYPKGCTNQRASWMWQPDVCQPLLESWTALTGTWEL